MRNINYNKVVIIGAPRSGTNMLRDMLVSIPGIGTWPCDEINYIWRHGNVKFSSDELTPKMATQEIKKYIIKAFDKIASKKKLKNVLEKTCANSLRVGFVNSVIPDSKYIFIIRDGIDATGSAKLRWKAKLNLTYVLKKARYVPKADMFYYALRYFRARLHLILSNDKRLAFWGPKLNGMQDILKKHSLNEVCAIQWQQCVKKADEALNLLPQDQVFRVQYESLVKKPRLELSRMLKFLEIEACEKQIEQAVVGVSAESVGKGRQLLGNDEVKNLENLVGITLSRFGYLQND